MTQGAKGIVAVIRRETCDRFWLGLAIDKYLSTIELLSSVAAFLQKELTRLCAYRQKRRWPLL